MSKNLFDGSDESDVGDLQINTNKEYAKSYNNFRKKELLKKFKDRGYDVADSDSSSNSETSSDEDEVVDMKFDQEFLKTLASLKSKDPTIYDKNTQFFQALNDNSNESEDKTDISKNKRSKPITLKDYERQIILDKGGKFEDDSEDDVVERPASPTLIEEERRLKEEFKNVNVNGSDDDEEADTFGGIFKKRTKTKEDQDKEDADYLKWLAGKTEDIEEPIKETLKPLKNYWSSNKLSQRECFLRDFILNKGYANTKSSDIPTYDEIVGDKQPLSEDEEELEKQAEFEKKYNFRFEEPDTEFIKRYPRTIEQSVRQSDDRRKEKRQEIKERKKLEKEQKMKELELVKDMKRREIEEKIRKLKMVTGNEELGFKDEELEEDFDPAAHDQRMQEIFNDEYYQVDEGEEKPECPSDIEDLKFENWDNYDPNDGDNYDGPHCEDEDFNMDCDYDPETSKEKLQKELIENTKRRKGRKGRKNEFMELIKSKKPAFDPEDEKTYEEYIDEYYKLDCEDMIGDVPCRFKYVETTPNDFGLTIEEILLAKNKELNQWASLKKTIQIRPEHMEKKDQRLYKMKAKNEALKRKIFKSLYGEGSDDDDDDDADDHSNLLGISDTALSVTEVQEATKFFQIAHPTLPESTVFRAPFFAAWFFTNFSFFFFPIYVLGRMSLRKCDKPGEILGDVLRGFRDRGFTIGRFLNRCLSFCILWLVTTYLYTMSLRVLFATDAMALFATNVACVYLLSWVILHEQFVGVRIVAVILCDTGIALLAYMDGITESRTLSGVVLATLGAAGYAVFRVMFRKVMGDPPIGQIAFTFTTLGFLNALLLWPVCVGLYLAGYESMPPDRMPWIILLIASILLLVFHILMQFSAAVTYNMFVTLGLITAVPVSGALDVVLYGATFAGMKLAGVILIAVGFFLVMFPENWPDYITRLLRNIILLGHNASRPAFCRRDVVVASPTTR
uniref:Protein KRI1 homolog n=1 Tax=Ceratitis capitata TaxID=7213 RepID=W8BBB5_CERCA